MITTKKVFYSACVMLVFILASCTTIVNRGHLKEDEEIARIQVGVTNQSEVLKELGSPSSESSFGPKTWYYVSSIRQNRPILEPKIIDEHTVEIAFDAQGVVTSVKQYSLADAKNFQIAKRYTPTEGQQLGFFEQIFANLGRFNKNGDSGIGNDHGHGSTAPTGYPGR